MRPVYGNIFILAAVRMLLTVPGLSLNEYLDVNRPNLYALY